MQQNQKEKPLMRDFIGLNTHTVQFKTDLYQPVTRLLRDYHNFNWDVGDDTSRPTQFPMTQGTMKVNWEELYGSWRKAGYKINATVQFGRVEQKDWKDPANDAYKYGLAFGKFFGPSSPLDLLESMEIGNEPGHYDDAFYRAIFENMARGLREADPKLKIATCATFAHKSGKYHKNIETVKGLEHLYDIINVHSYAQAEGYPTWRRSFPEDPKLKYLTDIQELINWREANAPGKQVWLTEFGWDSTTKPQATEGTFKDWVGVTDTQQAQYIVRSFLVFSAMDMDRAYLYWFNDSDKPSVHSSSGLTRNYQPKPSFHAVAHLLSTLGDYRFSRVVTQKTGDLYVYEFQHATDPTQRIWAVWSPTGADRQTEVNLSLGVTPRKAERMPLAPGTPESVSWKKGETGEIKLTVGESPIFLWLKNN
jgi:serine/threonine-protein kinase ATR